MRPISILKSLLFIIIAGCKNPDSHVGENCGSASDEAVSGSASNNSMLEGLSKAKRRIICSIDYSVWNFSKSASGEFSLSIDNEKFSTQFDTRKDEWILSRSSETVGRFKLYRSNRGGVQTSGGHCYRVRVELQISLANRMFSCTANEVAY